MIRVNFKKNSNNVSNEINITDIVECEMWKGIGIVTKNRGTYYKVLILSGDYKNIEIVSPTSLTKKVDYKLTLSNIF